MNPSQIQALFWMGLSRGPGCVRPRVDRDLDYPDRPTPGDATDLFDLPIDDVRRVAVCPKHGKHR